MLTLIGMCRNSPCSASSFAISSLYSSGTKPVVNLMRMPFSSSSLQADDCVKTGF